MRTIKPRPPDLTRLLFDLGPRTLVLVEGDEDCDVFREWYLERRSEVEFYPAGGHTGVDSLLQEVLAHSTTQRAYGIIDRDFRSDAEVDASLNGPSAHLFILRRYALENYLLEPGAVFEELRVYHGAAFEVCHVGAMEASLLQLCQQLRTVVAANWVFYEVGGIEYFREGHDISDREQLIHQTAQRLNCDKEEAKRRIAEKEALLDPMLATLDTAYIRISGKHLLRQVYEVHVLSVKKGLRRDHFRNLLARAVKRLGLHTDITTIVEGRILGHG